MAYGIPDPEPDYSNEIEGFLDTLFSIPAPIPKEPVMDFTPKLPPPPKRGGLEKAGMAIGVLTALAFTAVILAGAAWLVLEIVRNWP